MAKIRVLVVEDELLIAEELAASLSSRGFTVLEICEDAQSARRAFEIYQIDIILIDIKLKGDENGIQLAKWIRSEYSLPIIFTTSLIDDQTVKDAFDAKPSAYLVKPYNYKELEIAISMAMFNFSHHEDANPQSDHEIEQGHFLMNSQIFIKDKHRFERVQYSEIEWLKAESSYVSVHTKSKDYLLTNDTLGSFLDRVNISSLLRIHRSYAANINSVQALEGNQLCIGATKIPIGKNYRSKVKQCLNIQ